MVKTFVCAHLTGYRDIKSDSEFEEMEVTQETFFEDQVESSQSKSIKKENGKNKKNPFRKSVVSNEVIDKHDLLPQRKK